MQSKANKIKVVNKKKVANKRNQPKRQLLALLLISLTKKYFLRLNSY